MERTTGWSQGGVEHCVPLQGADVLTLPAHSTHLGTVLASLATWDGPGCLHMGKIHIKCLQNIVGELVKALVFRLHAACVRRSVCRKQQGQEKEKHLCKTTKCMWKRSELNLCPSVYSQTTKVVFSKRSLDFSHKMNITNFPLKLYIYSLDKKIHQRIAQYRLHEVDFNVLGKFQELQI